MSGFLGATILVQGGMAEAREGYNLLGFIPFSPTYAGYEADLSRPIVLSASGIMMDGMHRVAKAWILGMKEIQAVQFLEDPPADQILPLPEKKKRHNTSFNLPRGANAPLAG